MAHLDQRSEYHYRLLYPRASNPARLGPEALSPTQSQPVRRLPRRCLVSRLPSPQPSVFLLRLVYGLTFSNPDHSTISCSIVRITVNSRLDRDDVTWSYVACTIWSTIEGNVGVICACLPVLAPVLHAFAALFGSPPSDSAAARSKRAYRRSSTLEDLANFARLEEDTTQPFPIRKTVKVETVATEERMNGDAFDVRRPGDT